MGLNRPATGAADAERALGILGGTFDPIHLAHLALAQEARRVLELDHVLLIPNADPPHKQGQVISAAVDREAMVAAAIEGQPGLLISRIELERPGPSYAVDTVAELATASRTAGRPEPWFILSAEILETFDTWREPDRILELCRLAVAPRLGTDLVGAEWVARHFPGREDRFRFLSGPQLDIASTVVRERVGAGEPIDELVPPAVASYIDDHGLYRQPTERSGDDRGAVEEANDLNDVNDKGQADPRDSSRPGLPVTRSGTDATETLAPAVIPTVVDESILALAHRIVELASDKKASDIVLLDVRAQTTMTDYFVICTGASDRQLGAIADGIVAASKDEDEAPLSREGDASSHWLLIDYGGVIVHIMSGPEREFYQLEKLWADAALLLHVL